MQTLSTEQTQSGPPAGLRLQVSQGLHLQVHIWGNDVPKLLFIHGFGDGAFVWEPCVASLDIPMTMAALDLRGHGDSAWDPSGRYSQRVHISDVTHVIETMNLRDVVLVGHSLGAEIAMRAAISLPDRVRALVLVDGGATPRAVASDRVRADFSGQPRLYPSPYDYATLLASRMLFADAQTLLHFASRALRAASPDGFTLKCDPALRSFTRGNEDPPVESFLPRIDCPTLLLRGGKSAFLPLAAARATQKAIRRCDLVNIDMSGHAVMLDNPAGLCDALRPFLISMLQ